MAQPSPLSFDPSLVPLVEDGSGGYRLKGTRVSLDTVIEEYRRGGSVNTIIDAYRTLNWDDVYAVLQWYRQNGEVVDTHLRQRDAQAEALRREIEAKQGQDNLKEKLLQRSRWEGASDPLPDAHPPHCWHTRAGRRHVSYREEDQYCCWCGAMRVYRACFGIAPFNLHGAHCPEGAKVCFFNEPYAVYPPGVDPEVCPVKPMEELAKREQAKG